MDTTEDRDLATDQEPEAIEDAFLQKRELLGEIAGELALVFAVTPIVSSAVMEHVFQSHIRQFYEAGETYLPNIGLLRYRDGGFQVIPSDAFLGTLKKMQEADQSDEFMMALIDKKLERCQTPK